MNRIWVKITTMVISIILLLMALVFHFFTIRQAKTEREEMQRNMERVAQQIASVRLTDSTSWRTYQEWIENIISSSAGSDIVYIAIMDDNHNIAAHALNDHYLDVENAGYLTRDEELQVIDQLSNGQISEESWNDFDNINVSLRLGERSLGKVEVGFSLIEFNNRMRNRLKTNVYIIFGAMLLGLLLSIWMSKSFSKPLEALSEGMQSVSKGNLDIQIKNPSTDEIGDLTRSFNIMARRLREKNTLERFSRDLTYVVDMRSLIKMVTEQIVKYAESEQCIFFLFDDRQNYNQAEAVWAHPIRITEKLLIEIDQNCKADSMRKSAPFSPIELSEYECFRNGAAAIRTQFPTTKFELVIPLVNQGEVLGFLLLGKKITNDHYDETENQFLQTMAQQAGLAVRNAMLLRELTEHERAQKELEIAATVQQKLLPVTTPQVNRLELSGFCHPATEVGGDYYDYFRLDEHRVALAIADVSGKGTSAAFYMAELKGMVTSLAYTHASPKTVVCELNRYLGQNLDKRVFATMIYGILDTQLLTFTFVRAGHNALVRLAQDAQQPDVFIPSGLGLGLTKGELFEQQTCEQRIQLSTGDLLFFYTDGLSEAMDESKREFSEERLYNVLVDGDSRELLQIQRRIMASVNEFTGNAPQHDDITMILAKIL